MLFWNIINLVAYILGFLGGFVLLFSASLKYKQTKFKPFLQMGIGLFLTGFSFIFDFYSRFLGPDSQSIVFLYLRISVIFFYPGSLLALSSFLIVQQKTPWLRLIVYSVLFGMMIELHLSDDYYVVYDSTYEMWFTYFTNLDWMNTLDFLTSLPMLDILIYVIRRQRLGFVSNSAKKAVLIFWVGMIIPNLVFLTRISDVVMKISLQNLAFVISLLCFGFAFIKEPLVFTLSKTKYYEIIIAASQEGEIAVGQYRWLGQETHDLKSQALSAINILLNDIVSEDPSERNNISRIDLGKKKVVIERSSHFIGYMIVSAEDLTILYGLKEILKQMETIHQNNTYHRNELMNTNDFKGILRSILSFAQSINLIT